MSREADKQRERNRQYNESQDNVGTLAKAALGAAEAVGAAAAFYRTGQATRLSGLADRTYRFLGEARNIQRRNFASDDWNIDNARKAYGEMKDAWRKLGREFSGQNRQVHIRGEASGSLFGFIQQMRNIESGRRSIENNVISGIAKTEGLEYLRKSLISKHKLNDQQASRFEQMIQRLSSNIHNAQDFDATAAEFRKRFRTDKEKDAAKDMESFMVKQLHRFKSKKNMTAEDKALLGNIKKQAKLTTDAAYDIETMEKTYGTSRQKGIFGKAWSAITSDQAGTVRDFLKLAEEGKVKLDKITYKRDVEREVTDPMTGLTKKVTQQERVETDAYKEMLALRDKFRAMDKADKEAGRESRNLEQRFLDLTPDTRAFRKAGGDFYGITTAPEIADDILRFGASTLPGKILKMRHIQYDEEKAQVFHVFAKGTKDPFLAARTNMAGSDDGRLDANYYQVGKKLYRGLNDGTLEDVSHKIEDMELVAGTLGPMQRLIHQMEGSTRYKEQENALLHYFDINQDRSEGRGSFIDLLESIGTKYDDENWMGNVLDSMFHMTPNQRREMLTMKALRNDEQGREASYNYALDYLRKAKRIENFMQENTYELSEDAIQKILATGNATSNAAGMLKIINGKSDKEVLSEILSLDTGEKEFLNEGLKDLIHSYNINPQRALNHIYRKTGRAHIHAGSSLGDLADPNYNGEYESFFQQLRMEIGKEALLVDAKEKGVSSGKNFDFQKTLNLLEEAGIQRGDDVNARRLLHLGMFQASTAPERGTVERTTDDIWDQINRIHEVTTASNEKIHKSFRETMEAMREENLSAFDTFSSEDLKDVVTPEDYSKWIHVKKGIGVSDIIRDLNEGTLQKAKKTTASFFKQWTAGRDNMKDVTEYTFAPYFFVSRLSDDMNWLGLGFSKDNMGSLGDMLKAAGTKRILPAMLAWNYYDWFDDTVQEITGTGTTAAFVGGLANVDLAMRKGLDALGLTEVINNQKSINPIMQYWGDHTPFMSYDERKDDYENGYDPVRKGAWWTFGGVNEARGAEIQYWQPGLLRRLKSDYYNKAMYDGYFDKWSHSWLPTPTNPLSPLFALMDPYWLEEKHADDRPYALSGSLFQEGTPWGAVLNPTLGELIKPQKELHNWRLRNGVDVQAIVKATNDYIKAKAKDIGKQNYFVLHGNSATPVSFSPFDAPTPDTKVMSFYQGGNGNGYSVNEGVYGAYGGGMGGAPGSGSGIGAGGLAGRQALLSGGFNKVTADKLLNYVPLETTFHDIIENKLFGDGQGPIRDGDIITNDKGEVGIFMMNDGRNHLRGDARLTLQDKFDLYNLISNGELHSLDGKDHIDLSSIVGSFSIGNLISTAKDLRYFHPRQLTTAMNEETKGRAAKNRANMNEFDSSEGIITPEKLTKFRPTMAMSLLDDADVVAELINAGKGADFVKEATQSARLIAGIYGYMASAATGFGVYNDKYINTAIDMTSFSRAFWDSGIGGAGGGVMEIVRRFIPNYQRNNGINPLMNEMQDWLPERFRFGDPFTKVPKGEMRLPGKGYESLNELHPDQFGDYGAFDRFKILADIAPFTPEYKLWRDIAKKTVLDPELQEEMQKITSRVTQQGKKHDFYDYKVVGHDFKYEQVVVSEVLGYGKFKSGNQTYKLAGARVVSNADQNVQEVFSKYLHVGDTVTIAVDTNEAYQKNRDTDKTINVAVFNDRGSVAEQMLEAGDAVVRKSDTSTVATIAGMSSFQRAIGYASEVIAHADVPWLSDQFLRVRTPLESYNAEQVYGTPYQTWSHPIDTFLMPAIERAVHERDIFDRLETIGYNYLFKSEGMGKWSRHALNWGYALSNRGAFIGAALATVTFGGNGEKVRSWMRASSNIVATLHLLEGGSSYADEMSSGAMLGAWVAEKLKKEKGMGALVGAGVSGAYRFMRHGFDNSDYVPDRTKRKWQEEEYYDKLTFMKYMGLYHEAAQKAEEEEDVDVEEIIERQEKEQIERENLMGKLKKIKETLNLLKDSPEKARLKKLVQSKMNSLEDDKTILKGGGYTHSALIYHQAAMTTMAALQKGSSWSQIVTALPKNDREYFMEFVKERDEDKREEILRTVSPQLQKALNLAWGKGGGHKTDEQMEKETEEFFEENGMPLPDKDWYGWRPDIDLEDIKVKEIANEGENLSDFGMYESQLRDPDVINAPSIHDNNGDDVSNVRNRIQQVLYGNGLSDVEVNVTERANGNATQIFAALKQYTGFGDMQKRVNQTMTAELS